MSVRDKMKCNLDFIEEMMDFNGVRLPSGIGKAVKKVWFFKKEDNKWVMRTKGHVIHKFETEDAGLQWWKEFGEFRGMPHISLNKGKPLLKQNKMSILTMRGMSLSSNAPSASKNDTCPSCHGANLNCYNCYGSGLV